MTIKEIIDKERGAIIESRGAFTHWSESDMCEAFDRIEAAVTQELEDIKRSVFTFMNASTKASAASLKMTDFALDVANKRIAELEKALSDAIKN